MDKTTLKVLNIALFIKEYNMQTKFIYKYTGVGKTYITRIRNGDGLHIGRSVEIIDSFLSSLYLDYRKQSND